MKPHPYADYAFAMPEPLRLRVASAGDSGRDWVTSLPERVGQLARNWQCVPGRVLTGGTEALIFEAELHDGSLAVVKMGLPASCDCAAEARVLRAASGRGYVELLAHDAQTNALLLERLGDSLASSTLPTVARIERLCETMAAAWVDLAPFPGLVRGDTKAEWLAAFISKTASALPGRCTDTTLEFALACAGERAAVHRDETSVLVHGDAHDHNALLQLDGGGLKFVDPDGLFAEPACDLAVPMREWSSELLAGDTIALGEARCRLIASITDVDEQAIWQWGFVERVSTGLLLTKLGMERSGREMLAVADIWSEAWT